MAGPLLIAAALALGGQYTRLAFVLLAIPGALALVALIRLRRSAPDPTLWEPAVHLSERRSSA